MIKLISKRINGSDDKPASTKIAVIKDLAVLMHERNNTVIKHVYNIRVILWIIYNKNYII